ncbi:hypothetical protein FXF51_16040 [Nonomuraea sp. PA05]|uniref:GTPase-associated protein 1-related protein n=1 Tax=Nonomuraea sp. PA05 TaxID=2604466 RepID=UPI0011D515FC|nr:GTPase-associated protein 1-related protein [Nonomuraea sp. PA05]TYB66619.1 hypothetical protein FXF51_16040 [Nonomuraea sp. PA05]
MDFHQLYYTSCRSGLSGYAGYQFNAVTPGVAPEVMSEVEALSSYEPPSTLGHSPTPEQIAGCPVNLCFVPGPRPIAANVVFTGTDYSGRFGNYFAHALVPEAGSWQGPLPIELWRAALWTRETVDGTELPPVPSPLPAGPLGRDAVDDFLDRAPGRSLLPALLSAVERAVLDEERSVVIYAADADEVARWIAAVSFLLPPPVAARMSFATYQFRPSYSRYHVIGTQPGAEIVADERSFQAFYLFDFTTGRASEAEVGPLPVLLAAAGTVAAGPLWRRAAALAAGGEVRLADWYAVAVAAALLDGGVGVGPEELDAVCAWMAEHGPRLDGGMLATIAAAVLGHDAVSAAHLTGLADAAAEGGQAELLAQTEELLVTRQVAEVVRPEGTDSHAGVAAEVPPAVPVSRRLRSQKAREFAADRYTRALAEAGPATVLRLLRLAVAHDIRPDARALRECGLRTIGPELVRQRPEPATYEAVQRWPDLRSGVLACLDHAAAEGRSLREVFELGLDTAIPEEELLARPALREAALLVRARRQPERRVDTALALLSGRGRSLDETVLRELWPGGWSVSEAMAMLRRLPSSALGDPVLVAWVTAVLDRPLPDGDRQGMDSYAALCGLLARLPLTGTLPAGSRDRVAEMVRIHETERRIVDAARQGDDKKWRAAIQTLLAFHAATKTPAVRTYLRTHLAEQLVSGPHERLPTLIAHAPPEIAQAYLDDLDRQLGGEQAGATAATAFATLYTALAHRDTVHVADALQDVLLTHLSEWRKRDLNDVEHELRGHSNRMADEFRRWRLAHCRPRRRWLPSWPSHS